MIEEMDECTVARLGCLHDHLAEESTAPCADRDLREELERPFGRTEIRQEHLRIGADHAAAGGATQSDLDLSALKMLERRSVAILETKMRDYLRAQSQQTQLPKFDAESHYIESGVMKLAVVRVRSPKVANQVYVYGVKGKVFHRVACAKTKNFDQAIPLFYGPCSDKIREVFGVSINPRQQ